VTELPYAGAPKVDDPLDTGRFEQDPCQALTSNQAGDLEVEWPGESREAPLGKACTWRGQNDRQALVEVAAQDKYPYGLSAVYQGEADGKWEFFTELDPVEGYPAVSYGPSTWSCSFPPRMSGRKNPARRQRWWRARSSRP
jgi:hypothetical protein